jgi:hypothetical protein
MKEKYTPGEGCQCHAHSEAECGCDVDWTPREVYELREQRDRLLEEREQWRLSSVCRELREQRDRLAEEIENLKASGIHTCHDQCKRPMCVMRRERDRLQNELNELKEDRDAWKSEALIMDARLRGVKHPNDNGIFSPHEVIPKLERELAEAREQIAANHKATLVIERMYYEAKEQRDKLAEVIRKHRDELKLTSGDSVDRILWNVLDAVEGGSDE